MSRRHQHEQNPTLTMNLFDIWMFMYPHYECALRVVWARNDKKIFVRMFEDMER